MVSSVIFGANQITISGELQERIPIVYKLLTGMNLIIMYKLRTGAVRICRTQLRMSDEWKYFYFAKRQDYDKTVHGLNI